jgi:hypothetical protein
MSMGRMKPQVRLSAERRAEVNLAMAVDDAVAAVVAEQSAPAAEAVDGDSALQSAVLARLEQVELPVQPSPPIPPILLRLVTLDGMEVTQEIQDLTHSVPLVAGKATIVRVYLKFPTAVEVRGQLQVARSVAGPWQTVPSLGTAQLDPARSGSTLAQLRSRRANLTFSLNFRLPPAVTTAGTLFLRMGPVQRTTGTLLPSIAGLSVRNVTFRPAAPLRVRLVRMRYTMGTPARTFEPTATDATLFASWLRRAYPTDQLILSTSTATANVAPPFGAAQINAQLIALRAVDVGTGTDGRTHYYGMVSDGGFFMRGLASGIPQTPQPGTVASGPTGPGTFGWDNDGSYGDWYGGHELGHTFGRFHAEFCGAIGGAPYPFPNGQLSDADEAFVGIDVGDAALGLPLRLLGGVTSHDVMTYCNNEWLSSFTYGGIYQRLVAENALPAGAGAGQGAESVVIADAAAESSGIRVIAAVNLTAASGTITAVLPSAGDAESERGDAAENSGASNVTLRVLDADGQVIDERPAAFLPSACEDPEDDVTGVVDTVLPAPPGQATVQLLVDGQPVDSHPVGGAVAEVGALRGEEGAGLGRTPDGGLSLQWQTPDAPAGQRYIVQVSDDAGENWRTLAVGLAEPAVTISGDELGGETLTVRLMATTGTGTTVMSVQSVQLR